MLKPIFAFAAIVVTLALVVPRVVPNVGATAARTAVTPSAPPSSMPVRRGPNGSAASVRSDRRGQFFSDIEINGRTFPALVDTGATSVALRYEDARELGLLRQERFDRNISTANGVGRGMAVRLNTVRIGDVVVYDVEAMILQPGALTTNLLGMSFLRRLSRFEVKSDVVVLEQ